MLYMRTSLILIITIFIVSCKVRKERDLEDTVIEQESNLIITNQEKEITTKSTWGEKQNSLKKVLLNSKPNEALKLSMLQEFYIKGVVDERNGMYEFTLNYDLHDFDCGAPDCYFTNITFRIPATNPVSFPSEINFKLIEDGCVDKKISKTGTFELVEQTPEFVNYYSKNEQSNLLLLGIDKNKEYTYYFTEVDSGATKKMLIDELLDNYNQEDSTTIAPYRITTMRTREYGMFLEEKSKAH